MKLLFIILFSFLATKVSSNSEHEKYEAVRNSKNFTDRVVLVTGSSSGIGAAIAKLFSTLGAKVVVTGLKEEEIKHVGREVEALSPHKLKPLEVVADLTKTEDLNRLLNETIHKYGKLDVLVNIAGVGEIDAITDSGFLHGFDKTLKLDLRSLLELTQKAVPYLEKTKGTVINLAGTAGLKPSKGKGAFSMVKSAVIMATQVAALELGHFGIRVNSVSPGCIADSLEHWSHSFGGDLLKEYLENAKKRAPLGRNGRALDVAKGVAFLASCDAEYITGHNLVVDGGSHYNTPGNSLDDYLPKIRAKASQASQGHSHGGHSHH